MAAILYSGQEFILSDELDVDELASYILDSYGKGAYSWLTLDPAGARQESVRLMIGPGIQITFVND